MNHNQRWKLPRMILCAVLVCMMTAGALATDGSIQISSPPISLQNFLEEGNDGSGDGTIDGAEPGPEEASEFTVTFLVDGAPYNTQTVPKDTLVQWPEDPAPPGGRRAVPDLVS